MYLKEFFFIARQKIKSGPFLDSPDLMNPVGCNRSQLSDILVYCGFNSIKLQNERSLFLYNSNKKQFKLAKRNSKKIDINKKSKTKKTAIKKKKTADPDSPFAVLEKLL